MKTLITPSPYDFETVFEAFKLAANRLSFPEEYLIDSENEKQIELVLRYFIGDKTVESEDVFLHKGLMLCGSIGAGKTVLLEIIQSLSQQFFPANYFQIVRARDLVLAYESKGARGIERYIWNTEDSPHGGKKTFALCLDDIGIGNENAHYYANHINVIAEILLGRYAVLKDPMHRKLTHITTNLNADKMEAVYGNRVRSRLREMFNVILFTGKDRRK